MHTRMTLTVAALAVLAGSATPASAQWIPNYQNYTIQRIGLFGPEQTGSAGLQISTMQEIIVPGWVLGTSARFTGGGTFNGQNTWIYNSATGTTSQTGLTTAAHTGSAGYQLSINEAQNAAGLTTGLSVRYTGLDTDHGWNTWIYNPSTNTTVQTGLTSAAHTGSEGLQISYTNFLNNAGHVAGVSLRYTGVDNQNGQNTWAYRPTTNTIVQTGLTGTAHTGSAGYQFSENLSQNAAGQIVGFSYRITGAYTINGQSTWAYNPTTNTTVQTGLTGAAHTGSAGYPALSQRGVASLSSTLQALAKPTSPSPGSTPSARTSRRRTYRCGPRKP